MYPLKFVPVFQKRIWGGQKIKQLLGRPVPAESARAAVGESWELADLPPGSVQGDSTGAAPDGSLSSLIANGKLAGKTLHQAILAEPTAIMGAAGNGYFPLLIKFLDARENLSVQVHPDAAYVQKHPGAHRKSEAWYVLAAEPGAKIYKGLKPGVDRIVFSAAARSGRVEPLLQAVPARTGDCHYLESGTVHALGAGVLVAEVQTPSDTTFRLFDWNRLGADGKPRELHIEPALEVIGFDAAAPPPAPATTDRWHGNGPGRSTELAHGPHFSIRRVSLEQGEDAVAGGRAVVWICIRGQGVLTCQDSGPTAFAAGETLLIPAGIRRPRLAVVSPCTWLEAHLPESPGN